MKTLRFTLQMVLGIVLPLLLQLADRRRLTFHKREQGWNRATWGAALYAFGPLSMLGWCWVTRSDWKRWAQRGIGSALLRSVAVLGVGLLIAAVLGAIMYGLDEAFGAFVPSSNSAP